MSRKDGIVELARGLVERGFEVLSTGGTASELEQAGVAVTGVSKATGFPEILDGRVKTLHPKIHGGILARRELPEHTEALEKHAHRADRRGGGEPLPVRGQGREGRELRRGGRERRHRRAHDGARRGQELRVASRWWSIPPTTRCCSSSSTARAGSTRRPGSTSRRRPSATPAATRPRSPPTSRRSSCARAASCRPRSTRRSPTGSTSSFEKVQDLRYGENPHQRAAFYSDLGSGALLGGRGAPAAGQGALLQQHPRPRRGLAAWHRARPTRPA